MQNYRNDFSAAEDHRSLLAACKQRGEAFCLAIVAKTWGSSPRPAGSILAVFAADDFIGSVSGGCIEADVIAEALEMLSDEDYNIRRKHFGIADEEAWRVGLACGGKMEVLLVAIIGKTRKAVIATLAEAVRDKRMAIMALSLGKSQLGLWRNGEFAVGDSDIQLGLKAYLSAAEIATLQCQEQARLLTISDADEVLLCPYPPPKRLVILGAVHIALDLAMMAQICDYEVHIIDPRAAWIQRPAVKALLASIPADSIRLHQEWPDTVLEKLNPDARTAFVALTHDPKLDDPALTRLLAPKAPPTFYIGALGSTKTHAKRIERLQQAGISKTAIAKIHAPVGLNINATTPAEIATAILAQITATLRIQN